METRRTEPEPRDLTRRVLRFICLAAALISAIFAGSGVQMAGQIVNDEIPPGRIVAILGQTKGGTRVRLDSGQEVLFSNLALFRGPKPIELAVGDRVEKEYQSCVYLLNGKALTDFWWVFHEYLLPARVFIPLGLYLLGGTVFMLKYRRTPHGDWIWSDPERPRRPRTRWGLFAMLLVNWLLLYTVFIFFWGCLFAVFSGIGKVIFG
ncbi:MAG TPA: hypothetical protein VN541_20405 [Tepidisphaeraceae bacterium]|nr:hypothetical protein [Tepidisphaeraceae bacterium]